MNFNRAVSRVCLCVALLCCAASVAAEPQWIINNGEDYPLLTVIWGRGDFTLGLATFKPIGTDVIVYADMEGREFRAEDRPFFAIRCKMTTKEKEGGIFFTNDDSVRSFNDSSFSPFEIVGNGEWRDIVMDMRTFPHKNWKGVITGLRLDPINPSDTDSVFSLSRFGFFPSEDAAREFLAAANDEPDYSMDAVFVNSVSRALVPSSVMSKGGDAPAFLVKEPEETPRVDRMDLLKERETYHVYWTPKGETTEQPVLLSDVTSLRFATYIAPGEGTYRVARAEFCPVLTDIADRPDAEAIRFAVCRRVISPGVPGDATGSFQFNPDEPLAEAEAKQLSESCAQLAGETALCAPFKAFAERLAAADAEPVSRAEAARLYMKTLRDVLGTSVESPYDKEYFTRERLRIAAWGNFRARDFGEDDMRAFADCGFDFVLGDFIPSLIEDDPTVARDFLPLADKYGIEVLVNDWKWDNPGPGQAEYIDHPSYSGHSISDEPGTEQFDELAEISNRYSRITGRIPFVNLLPKYANAAQFKYGAEAGRVKYYDPDPDLYRKYCVAFCEKFDTNYVCTDIYPLDWDRGKKRTASGYIEAINIPASVAREYGREFWCYIQTFAWTGGKRTPTEAEYRWQCYSMLSFGCRCIFCWTYAAFNKNFPALIDFNSRKTRAWYDARPVLWELRRLSDVYVQYRNLGAFTVNCTDATPYLKMTNEYKDFDAIREISCPDPLLVGCFEKKDDAGKAFTLVNMTDFAEDHGTTVRMKLDAESATAYYRGVPQTVLPDADGWFDFSLASGEGVFVTIEKRL